MTDQIPADLVERLHDLAGKWATSAPFAIEHGVGSTLGECADELRALLPTPPRPTLADMTEEEREECQWMQCDVTGFQGQLVLATPYDDDGYAGLISACGEMVWSSPGHVTPRPDLPRLEWPGRPVPRT